MTQGSSGPHGDQQEHLIRRSGQAVQDRPLRSVGWADIPELSTCVGCCSAAWLQSWLQSQGRSADPRPSAFQAGHIPSWRESCESYALSPVADDSGWLLLLLSLLLSAVGPVPLFRGLPADDSVTPWSSPPSPGPFPATRPRPVLSQTPPPNPIAAEPYGGRVLSRGGEADHE